jgi:hypothetical protein
VDPALAKKYLRPINLLLVAVFIGGFMLLVGNELMTAWLMPLYLLAYLPIFCAAYYFGLAETRTLPSLPPRELRRRRWFNYGISFWAVGQVLAFLSKRYVPTADWSHYISISGSALFILFVVAGSAPSPKSSVRSESH